jgi:hypothetical protein
MKKWSGLMLWVTLMIAVMIPAMAFGDTLTLTSDYSNIPQYDGDYVGPISATLTIGGTETPVNVMCDDSNNISYFGSTWNVTVHSLVNGVSGTMFGATAGVKGYEEAAWLIAQIPTHATSAQVGEIQQAVWDIFIPGAFSLDSTANAWLTEAENIDLADYNFSSCVIYTPTGSGNSNQEFTSGDPPRVPVPPSLLLFGSGLLGLVGWRGFRKA